MLTLFGKSQNFCDGINRRNFLQIGALGAGLSLADVLRARAATSPTLESGSRKARSAIMIFLPGGPPHMDMYDPKPAAPVEFRGEFQAIPTAVPGIQLSEMLPKHARIMDKLAVVRSLISVDEHSDSLVMTGYPNRINQAAAQGQHPSFGSVISKMRTEAADVPPFVSLRGMSVGTEPGFLGVAHRPFTVNGPGLRNLNPLNNVDPQERQHLLGRFDTLRRDLDTSGTMDGMDSFNQRAFEMISSGAVRDALDIKREDPRTRDRYKGIETFLTARRLVEAGVGCVTLSYGGWDTHSGNFKTMRRQLPVLDRGVTTLIEDLHERGMNDEVATIVWGEFGRTPKVNNNDGGRDHWAPVMSALVAGGGMQMGQAVGASSFRGEYPADRPYKVPQMLATLYRAMGIDPSMTFLNGAGRPVHLLDDREPIRELL